MFPASRWAARLSRPPIALSSLRRCIVTKSSGLPRKTSRFGLPPQNRHGAQQRGPEQQMPGNYIKKGREGPQEQRRKLEEQETNRNKNDLVPAGPSQQNDLVSPVHIPHDALSILPPDHPATNILANSTIVVQRQLEMMNIMLGFEQANKYVIMDGAGNHIGYLAEPEGNMLKRQMFKTHRGFTVHVFDKHEKEVLRITRPFTLINSRISVYDSHSADPSMSFTVGSAVAQVDALKTEDMKIIGEVHQEWALTRRKYNLFLNRPAEDAPEDAPLLTAGHLPLSNSTALQTQDATHRAVHMAQWAHCDEPWLSWDFSLRSADDQLLGSVNRNFRGFAREIFTDTGAYALRMDSAALDQEPGHIISKTGRELLERKAPGMALDQRAVMLATAVSIDFDYFSRKSGHGGFMPMPMWLPWGGGAAEADGAAEAGGSVGAAEGAGGLSSEVGAAARGTTSVAGESAAAGAGSLAGYDAMQRGFGRGDDASPTADPYTDQTPGQDATQTPQESFWGEDSPWNQQDGGNGNSPWTGGNQGGNSGAGGGGGGGDGGGFDWGDFF